MSFQIHIGFDELEHPEQHFFFRPVMDLLLKSGIVRSEEPFDMVSRAEFQAMLPIDLPTEDRDLAAIGLVTAMMVESYDRFYREWSLRATEKMRVRQEQIDAGAAALESAKSIGNLEASAAGAFAMGSFMAASIAWRQLHAAGYRWRKLRVSERQWSPAIAPPAQRNGEHAHD